MRAMVLLAACLSAQAQVLEFKGVPLGSDRAELLTHHPAMTCEKQHGRWLTLGQEMCKLEFGKCMQARRSDCNTLGSYGGATAFDHTFGIVDGRFEQFALTIPALDYERVRDALIEKYGKGSESARTLTTRGGAPLTSRTWSVTLPEGTLSALEHDGRIDQGGVFAQSKAFSAYVKALKPVEAKKGAKDL